MDGVIPAGVFEDRCVPMMPITGSMNNEKGCEFGDNWAKYVYAIKKEHNVINSPKLFTPFPTYGDYSRNVAISSETCVLPFVR